MKIDFVYDNNVVFYIDEFPWKIRNINNGYYSIKSNTVDIKSNRCQEIDATTYDYSQIYGLACATRTIIKAGEKTYFILDYIKADEEINIDCNFYALNKNKKISCNIADRNKVVIRNDTYGVKIFRLENVLDSENRLETAGLMIPNSFLDNNDMKMTFYSGLYNFAKEHYVLYGMCIDDPISIKTWHFKYNNGVIAEPPSGIGGYRIKVNNNIVSVDNTENTYEHIKIEGI